MAGSKVKTQMFVPSVPRVPGYKKSKAEIDKRIRSPASTKMQDDHAGYHMITTIPTILCDDSEFEGSTYLPVGGLSPSRRRLLETL
jgi:hypothetical protein